MSLLTHSLVRNMTAVELWMSERQAIKDREVANLQELMHSAEHSKKTRRGSEESRNV